MRETDTNCSNGKRKKGKESKSANSFNVEEVRPKTRKWSSQGREKWDEYAYWNSELKKSRKRKPTKHRKDKVEDQAMAESTTAEEKKPIKKKYFESYD